jgi:uncharacterized protein (DUF2141 family)
VNKKADFQSLLCSIPLIAKLSVIIILIVTFDMGCANMGAGPQGGPQDSIPPVMLTSVPTAGQLNYTKQTMEVNFDEIVKVENSFEKVVVSPPQKVPAIVKALGRKVLVELTDSLQENTSYTIDFSDAIVDNNENNKLLNFSLSFSTGDYIDSLQIGGTLLDASTLNPLSSVHIGIHSDLNDSAFTKKAFDRITKTDSRGNFTVKNIRPGQYHVFAISDINNNFRFDMPNERIAFLDSVYVPEVNSTSTADTILIDSISLSLLPAKAIDTIIRSETFNYTPQDIILLAFTEKGGLRQYLVKNERKERYKFTLYFSDEVDSLPIIEGLNLPFDSAMILQKNPTQDTLTYWIPDTAYSALDTLSLLITYRNTDTLGTLGWKTDTLNIPYRETKKEETSSRRSRRNQPPKRETLKIQSNAKSAFNVYQQVDLTFDIPSKPVDSLSCLIEQKVDTLWKFVTDSIYPLDSIGLKYRFDFIPQPSTEYRIIVDSAKFHSINGLNNDSTGFSLKVRSLEEYGKLIVSLPLFSGKESLQLLNEKDDPIRQLKAEKSQVTFEYLDPGIYFLRLFIDENGDGKWSTGKYADHLQAEEVFYFPYSINIRALWDIHEEWNYTEMPLIEQKPFELIPKEKSK